MVKQKETCRLSAFVCVLANRFASRTVKKVSLLCHVNEPNVFCRGNNICCISTKATIVARETHLFK